MVRESERETSMLSEKSARSEKSAAFLRHQGSNRRQVRRQEQRQRQDKAKMPAPQERLRSKVSVSRSPNSATRPTKRPTVVAPAKNGKLNSSGSSTIKFKPVGMRKLPSPNKRSEQRKTRVKPLLYILRLLILGIGIGAITGTVLSVLDPASRITAGAQSASTAVEQQQQAANMALAPSSLYLTQEITSLKTAFLTLAAKTPNLTPAVFFVDLDTGAYVDVNGSATFASASMIKFPILVALFQDVDAGKIRLDEVLTVQQSEVASGSGDIQYKPVGTQFTVLETATKMIAISDNTATNMVINRLGGQEALNQRFQSWGLTATQLRNPLPDLEGTNTTSPKDLANLMAMVSQGNLVSMRSRDWMLNIMRRTVTNSLLPSGLAPGAIIAHKTGDIGSMLGDVGLVDMPNGKRYIAVVMVKRPHNDGRASELIRSISRTAYQQFSQPVSLPSGTTTTAPTSSYQFPANGAATTPFTSRPAYPGVTSPYYPR